MSKINKSNLKKIIKNFSKQRVLVIGDLILDKYLWCEIERISPEAPVPVALVKSETSVLGGAANVANNLVSLGATVDLIGLVGQDSDGEAICQKLKEKNILYQGILVNPKRQTTVKKRVMCGNHQSLRIDHEDTKKIGKREEKKIFNYVVDRLDTFDVLIFSDYAKGLISLGLAKSIISLAKKKKMKVLADPTTRTFNKFKNSYLIKPNKKGAESIAEERFKSDYSNLENIVFKIKNKLNSNLVITLGKDGIAVLNGQKISLIPTAAKEVYDVSGAGDSAMATLALSLASGASIEESTIISNYCAGVVVSKLGTATCSQEELLRKMDDYEGKF